MTQPKVLLAQLEERTSANGTKYLSGWLGKARLVGFVDRDAEPGKVVWQIYAQEPQPRSGQSAVNGAQRRDGGHRRHDDRGGQQRQLPEVARRAAGDAPF